MDISNSHESQIPNGYLSDKHKRQFTITAGILSAVFFIIQMVLPMVLMMIIMPFSILDNLTDKQLFVPGAVSWKDSIWLIEEDKKGSYNLDRINPREPKKIHQEHKLKLEKPGLIAGNDSLWIISPHYVTQYFGQGNEQTTRTRSAGSLSKPFLLNGLPAAVKETPDGFSIIAFENGTWNKKHDLDLGSNAERIDAARDLQVLCDEKYMHIFLFIYDTLYYQSRSLDSIMTDNKDWEAVGAFAYGNSWQAVSNGEDLFVFGLGPGYGKKQIVGYKYNNDNWETFFQQQNQFNSDIGACYLQNNKRFVLLTQFYHSRLKILEIEGSKVVKGKDKDLDSDFPFGPGFEFFFIVPYSTMFILPLILAIILSSMMKKYRNCNYVAESREMPYASLIRRALAQVVDGLILGCPFILSFIFMFTFMNPDNMLTSKFSHPLLSLLLMLGGFPWIIIWLLIFSALEGKYGLTPGKWLLGIRVMGTDLQPCGFGRAFLRNILKFVDGFFNFLVGVIIAALSHNWQRIGDMAARTVVVDIRSEKQKKDDTSSLELR
ncbi:MAG: RDD family protein [Sedimentisphaerales bacterium]|nr:RDD family protein [Sedimentisphaerales bacterium]